LLIRRSKTQNSPWEPG